MVGKFLPIFPMIGKNFREATKGTKSTKIAGGMREGIYKNGEKTASRSRNALGGRIFETTWKTGGIWMTIEPQSLAR